MKRHFIPRGKRSLHNYGTRLNLPLFLSAPFAIRTQPLLSTATSFRQTLRILHGQVHLLGGLRWYYKVFGISFLRYELGSAVHDFMIVNEHQQKVRKQ
jgi:hypothetical protein